MLKSSKAPSLETGLLPIAPPPQRLLLAASLVEAAEVKISTLSFSINSALAVATIIALGGGGVIDSKYEGFSHSPKKASTQNLDLR